MFKKQLSYMSIICFGRYTSIVRTDKLWISITLEIRIAFQSKHPIHSLYNPDLAPIDSLLFSIATNKLRVRDIQGQKKLLKSFKSILGGIVPPRKKIINLFLLKTLSNCFSSDSFRIASTFFCLFTMLLSHEYHD